MFRRRGRRPRTLLSLLLIGGCLLTTGCWDRRPIEQQAIVIVLGADTNRYNPSLVDLTFGIPLFTESKHSFARISTVSAANYSEAATIWQAGSELTIATGKVRIILFGENMARQGLPALLNYVELARADNNALVAVVRGRAEDLLHVRLTETDRIGTYMANMLTADKRGGIVFAPQVDDLVTAFTVEGLDPILPLIEASIGQDLVSSTGSALFNDLNMVGEIDLRETRLLLALRGRERSITLPVTLGVTSELLGPQPEIRLLRPSAKLVPEVTNGELTVHVKFKSEFSLRNYYSIADLTKPETVKSLTADLESNLSLAMEQLLAKLQAAKTDPLGIGKKLRVKNDRAYDDNVFREMWAKASLKVTVDLTFIRAGADIQTERKNP